MSSLPRGLFYLSVGLLSALGGSPARSGEFPYSVGGLNWSATLKAPDDGRVNPGFTNGCVKLTAQKQAILDQDGLPIDDFNRCTKESNGQVAIADSEAATACTRIQGHLPSKAEFEQLIRSFQFGSEYVEGSDGPQLTVAGTSALSKAFGEDISQSWFWSSSHYNMYRAYGFFSDDGVAIMAIGTGFRRELGSIRCVEGM